MTSKNIESVTLTMNEERADQLAQALDRVRFKSAQSVTTFYGDRVAWYKDKVCMTMEVEVEAAAEDSPQLSIQSEPEIISSHLI